jgi:hypothetical protein
MGYLTATMGEELLQREKSERKLKVLDWLWPGYSWQMHDQLRKRRSPNTGKWFFKAAGDWINGEGTRPLVCHGLRMNFLALADFSRCRKIIYYVRST